MKDSQSLAPPPRLVWCTAAPSPYNNDFFGALAAALGGALSVRYAMSEASHPWKDQFGESFVSKHLRGSSWIRDLFFPILKRDFDVVVIAGWGTPGYAVALLCCVVSRTPYLLFTDAPLVKGHARGLKAIIRKHWLSFAFRRAHRIFGTGDMALANLASMGANPSRLVNLPYALDESRFPLGKDRRNAVEMVIVSSGRLVDIKGFDLGLEAVARVRAKGRAVPSLRYRIAGAGPELETLKALAKQLGLEDRVEFLGWQSQAELAGVCSDADLFLHPALFEPYGVSVVEALYSGLYVIAGDRTSAAVELLQHPLNGSLFKAGDLEDLTRVLAEAISRLAELRPSKAAVRDASMKWPLARCVDVAVATCRQVAIERVVQ